MPCHSPTEGVQFAFSVAFSASLSLHSEEINHSQLPTVKQLKQCELGGLFARLFHKKGKGVRVEQVVTEGGKEGCKKEARGAEAAKCRVSTRQAFHS